MTVATSKATAAAIRSNWIANSPMYQCEIFPNEVGRCEIHVLCNNEEIIGSPIHVHFKVPGDASKVRIVDSKIVESSDRVQFI